MRWPESWGRVRHLLENLGVNFVGLIGPTSSKVQPWKNVVPETRMVGER